MVVGLLPTVALAAGATNTWAVKLHVSENSLVKYNEQNTIELGFGVQSNNLALKTAQSMIVAIDLNVFDFIAKTGVAANESLSSSFTQVTSNKYAYSKYSDAEEFSEWTAGVYLAYSGNTGFVMLQPSQGDVDEHVPDEVILMSVLIGLKSGKSVSDITSTSIRLATKQEADSLAQSQVIMLTDGNLNTQEYGKTSGSDTLTMEPAISWDGITPAKAAYSGAAATISQVAKSGENIVVTATVPNDETAQYGYSATNSASSVSNWQDSNSFSAPAPGTYYFFARVKENVSHKAGGESAGTAYTVNGPLSLSYSAPASMTVDSAIADMTPTVSGGTGNYTNYAVTSGTLPTGLSINSTNGVISGTPTAVAEATQVTVTVTDSESSTTTYQINFPAVAKKANTMNSVTQADVEYGTAVNPNATSNGNTPTYQYKAKGADDNTYTNDAPTTVGEYTVKASSTGHATVADAIVTADFKITPKTLTNLGFTGVTVTKVYDGTTNAGAVGGSAITFDGKVNSDDVSITAVAGNYADKDAANNKTVTLTLSLNGAAKDNYKLASYTHAFSTAAVTPADYTYTVAGTQNFRTGTGLSSITVAPAAGTGVNSESVNGTLKWYSDSSYNNEAVDNDLSSVAAEATKTLYWKFTATNGNYSNTPKTGSTDFTAKNKEDLSASIKTNGITGLDKTYDGEAASYTGTATVTGYDALSNSLVYEWYKSDNTKLNLAPVNTGSYYLKVSIPDGNNDYLGSAKVDFTISQKEVTVSAGTYKVSKVYDGNTNTGTPSGSLIVTGILPADNGVTVQATPVAYTNANVGGQTSMNVNIALNGDSNNNYKIKNNATTVSVPCEITPKDITISGATATTRSYIKNDKSVVISGVTFTGASLTKDTDYTVTGLMDDANAGNSKTVNVTVTLTNGNYSLATNTTTTTVNIAQAAAQSLADITGSFKYTVTSGEKAIGSAGMPADAGMLTYAKGTESKTGSVTISSWAVDSTGKVTYTLSGGAANDTITLPVVISSTNYANSTVNVKFTLTAKDDQATLTVSSGSTVTYGQTLTLSSAGGSGTGAVTYEVVTGGTGAATITGNVLTPTTAGTVKVKAVKAADANYNQAESAPVTITINKATPTGTPAYTAITTSGKTLADAALTAGTITPAGGTIAWDLGNAQTVAANTAYSWTYTPADTTNYNNLTGSITPYVVSYGGGGGGISTYAITVDSAKNGTITVSPKSAAKGATVTITVKPDEGYELDTLKVVDKNGDKVAVSEKNSKYTFTMPASKVTVTGTFVEIEQPMVNPFIDVKESDYFYEAVLWAVKSGVTKGTSATTFSPNAPCTRAQMVTFLWRASGSPKPVTDVCPFTDVSMDSYYGKAVLWAVETGITNGTSETTFSPEADCTRAQMAAFLCRMAGGKAASSAIGFTDVSADAYYAESVQWAVENGITLGTGDGTTFSPNEICTRAQMVTFLYRFFVK